MIKSYALKYQSNNTYDKIYIETLSSENREE